MSIENEMSATSSRICKRTTASKPMRSGMNPRWRIWDVDSLGLLAMAEIVETKYGISLDDERIAGVRKFSDFNDLIDRKRTEVA